MPTGTESISDNDLVVSNFISLLSLLTAPRARLRGIMANMKAAVLDFLNEAVGGNVGRNPNRGKVCRPVCVAWKFLRCSHKSPLVTKRASPEADPYFLLRFVLWFRAYPFTE